MRAFKAGTSRGLMCLGAMIAGTLFTSGCGGFSTSTSSVQVWGRVTYNGQPVGYGALIFQPVENISNWGVGMISEDGKYSLVSAEGDVGLNPGRFDIYIRPPAPHDRPRHGPSGEEEVTWEKAVILNTTYPVPKRFQSRDDSALWVYLEKEPARLDIDLRD